MIQRSGKSMGLAIINLACMTLLDNKNENMKYDGPKVTIM